MGTVELALRYEHGFERLYAVKRLRPHVAQDDECRRMFLSEARIAGMIRNLNVVSVLDVGEDERGPFLVMEWVDGISASALMHRARSDGPIAPEHVAAIGAQVARGLQAAHELRSHTGQEMALVHRDVCPANILVGYNGVASVTDFGISKVKGVGKLTQTGVLKGKIGYMSPEQLRFEDVDQTSDLFSLGVVLFELLALQPLYSKQGRALNDVAGDILRAPAPPIGDFRRDVSPPFEDLLLRLLCKDREERPASAALVAMRLDEIVAEYESSEALGDYVSELFGPERLMLESRISEAIETTREAKHASTDERPSSVVVEHATLVSSRSALRARPRFGIAAGVVALLLLVVGGFGLFEQASKGASEQTTAPRPSVEPNAARVAPPGATSPVPKAPINQTNEMDPPSNPAASAVPKAPKGARTKVAAPKTRRRRARKNKRRAPKKATRKSSTKEETLPKTGEAGWNAK